MKIIQINEYCGIESTGKICFELAKMLENKGDICRIVYGRKKASAEAEKYGVRMTNDLGIRLHGVETRVLDNHAFSSTFETKRIVSFLEKFKPDIIHLHNLHGYYINVEILFKYIKKKNIPIIWTLHDCWAITGHCAHFSHSCDNWKTGCHHCGQIREYPASYVVDASKKNWKKKKDLFTALENVVITAPSFWLSRVVKDSYLSKYPVNIVPNGIDLNVFYPRDNNIFYKKFGNKKIILGVASIWNRNKGIDDFITLSNMLDDQRFQIVLVGGGIKEKDFPSSIHVIEKVDSADVLAEIYSSADIYVNLSKIEIFGLTTVEALACGCPVIVYEAGGSGESVGEQCGKVIANGDLKSVIDIIQSMILYDRTSVKNICVQQAEKYSIEYMLKKYYDLYKKMLCLHKNMVKYE
ncbi:MAG: glycosyltransferase [Ruminococcus sp.]|nr:glycosyltransferase [Ruminococcus sp.]